MANKLNVVLGLDVSQFQRGLNLASARLSNFSRNLESVGTDLTTRLTLPLAGVGAASLAAFAELDKFTKGLGAVMGSTEAAEAELVKLREVAKLPGLGFVEAVQGSTNLQAVGLSADQARATLQGFGAAIAATGGGAQELGEVQKQLTQIISKNRILQEDYGVLQERVPLIGRALKQAFGTENIEQVREAGVTGKQFVEAISQALITLPQTQNLTGGLANALENFGDSARVGAARLGEVINEALGVEEILGKVSDAINKAVDAFADLSPEAQKTIVVIAALALAIGPVLVGVGAIVKVAAIATAGFASITKAALVLRGVLFTLNGAIGAAIIAVALIAKEQKNFNDSINSTLQVRKQLEQVEKTALENTVKQKTEVNLLVAKLKDEKTSLEDKKKIIDQLNIISPEYFGQLSESKNAYEDATLAAADFNKELIRTARIQAAKEQLVELEKQLLNIPEAAKPTFAQAALIGIKSFGQIGRIAGLASEQAVTNYDKVKKSLEDQRDALFEIIGAEEDRTDIVAPVTPSAPASPPKPKGDLNTEPVNLQFFIDKGLAEQSKKVLADISKTGVKSFEDVTKAAMGLNGALKEIPDVKSPIDITNEALRSYQTEIENSRAAAAIFGTTAGDLLSQQIGTTTSAINQAIAAYGINSVVVEELTEKYNALVAQYQLANEEKRIQTELENTFGAAFAASAAIIEQSGASVKSILRSVGQAVRQAAAEFIQAKVKEATAQFIADNFKKAGIFGVIGAAAAGAIVGGLFNAALSKIGPPKLARGGITTGETLAVVGDNPSGREAIIPFERMGEFLDMAGGGGTRLSGIFEVRGQDLVLALDRANQTKSRIR